MRFALSLLAVIFAAQPPFGQAGSARASTEDQPFLARPEEDFYYTPSNCCGLVAVYLTLDILGHPADLTSLARDLPVTSLGTSMQDLAECLGAYGVKNQGSDLGVTDLCRYVQSSRLAIALVEPYHWIVVVPSSDGDRVQFFTYPAWRQLDRASFASVYMNKALLIEAPTIVCFPRFFHDSIAPSIYYGVGALGLLALWNAWITGWRRQCLGRRLFLNKLVVSLVARPNMGK